jgi:cholesterol oxidase
MAYISKPRFTEVQMKRITEDMMSAGSSEGALNHSMLYFACGHDSSGGKFIWDKWTSSFTYKWPNVLEEKTFKRINKVMAQYTEKLGGVFIPNPRATVFGGKHVQATHPLGGCPMGQTVSTGVVDHVGRVFNRQSGHTFHDGLYVVDAAIIPRSLAATPLLTITALAERIAQSILQG